MFCPGPGLENVLQRPREEEAAQPSWLQFCLSFHDSEPLEPGDLGPLPPRQIENLRWEGGASWLLVHFCGYILRSVGALTPGLKEIEGAAT